MKLMTYFVNLILTLSLIYVWVRGSGEREHNQELGDRQVRISVYYTKYIFACKRQNCYSSVRTGKYI